MLTFESEAQVCSRRVEVEGLKKDLKCTFDGYFWVRCSMLLHVLGNML